MRGNESNSSNPVSDAHQKRFAGYSKANRQRKMSSIWAFLPNIGEARSII